MDILLSTMKGHATVFDPFVGSGTVLTEAMRRGANFVGFDINPLAVLASKVKSGPFYVTALQDKADELVTRISLDFGKKIEADFPGMDKWFTREIAVELSKIRRAIRQESSLWARRFFWLTLAELVRQVSNSRTSTFKLHLRDPLDAPLDFKEVCRKYGAILENNISSYIEQAAVLAEILTNGVYQPAVKIKMHNSAMFSRISGLAKKIDIMVTSPPYGDNATTVPYGQFSYLPLQWIDLCDIDKAISNDILCSTHEIDARSLGGSIRNANEKAESLSEMSPSFWSIYKMLWEKKSTQGHAKRMAAFTYDLAKSIEVTGSYVKQSGYAVWTLGNRNTGGYVVPLAEIVSEVFNFCGFADVARIGRDIPYKRMPNKNSISATMTEEVTIIMRKE
ncbi:DNA methyltransferase [Paludibacterium sp. B53371]|uniref:DNA methyltransferase n=1 Tax=Paludibacterium sp. B53371 TaxID=2806263 RepID=UPI001C03BA11|nr:DNA methyltransferase [Paludibacterium sp. B53371]